jgi:hypothetical protein
MGSSEVARRHPPHHLGPAAQIARQGKTPKRASAAQVNHSNAPIRPESQSFPSKIVALSTPSDVRISSLSATTPILELDKSEDGIEFRY